MTHQTASQIGFNVLAHTTILNCTKCAGEIEAGNAFVGPANIKAGDIKSVAKNVVCAYCASQLGAGCSPFMDKYNRIVGLYVYHWAKRFMTLPVSTEFEHPDRPYPQIFRDHSRCGVPKEAGCCEHDEEVQTHIIFNGEAVGICERAAAVIQETECSIAGRQRLYAWRLRTFPSLLLARAELTRRRETIGQQRRQVMTTPACEDGKRRLYLVRSPSIAE